MAKQMKKKTTGDKKPGATLQTKVFAKSVSETKRQASLDVRSALEKLAG